MRFQRIVIEGFKNVEHGELSFENKRRPDGPSILALYGQNGSGKSALVDCLLAFKLLLVGDSLPQRFANYVNKKKGLARICYEFDFGGGLAKYEVEFKNNNGSPQLTDESFGILNPNTNRFNTVFTTKGYSQYGPKKIQAATQTRTLPPRRERFDTASSLFFTPDKEFPKDRWRWIPWDLSAFAEYDIYVVSTREAESIESGELLVPYDYYNNGIPFSEREWKDVDKYSSERISADQEKTLRLSTDDKNPSAIPLGMLTVLSRGWIDDVNSIVSQLVPGLTLEFAEARERTTSTAFVYIQSCREDTRIPLSCESRGIQKLVLIAWLLIRVYNEPDSIVVIDEIDSGIFEYLLGEILRIIAEEGEGQLIFTSHNLRPLEVLDKGYIAFTTTNQKQRYTRLRNVKTTNNLRDFYYRSIFLGGQKESIFDPPSNGDLSMAFMMASLREQESDEAR